MGQRDKQRRCFKSDKGVSNARKSKPVLSKRLLSLPTNECGDAFFVVETEFLGVYIYDIDK
jgi:hypothetical protein